MERTFTNGVRTEIARTPAQVVKLRFDGWREVLPSVPNADESQNPPAGEDAEPTNATGEDELPHGTTDDQ